MIKCPRCNFEQPEDQYCARCGVDMTTFVVPKPPITSVFFKSVYFQISVILIVVLGFAFYFNHQRELARQAEIKRRVEYLRPNSRPPSNRETETASTAPADVPTDKSTPIPTTHTAVAHTESASTEKTNPAPTEKSLTLERTGAVVTSPNTGTGGPKPAAEEKDETIEVQVYYTETQVSFLPVIFEDSRNTGNINSMGEYNAGPLSDIKKILNQGRSNRQISILQTVRKQFDKNQNSVQWFSGIKEPKTNQEIGLTTFITLATRENLIRGEIELLRSLRESRDPNQPPAKLSMQESFELSRSMGYFIMGALPHLELTEREMDLFQQSILKIYLQPSFVARESEFVIYIEFPQN